MRRIDITGQYKKDLKIARKRNLQEEELNKVILALAMDEELPESCHDHALIGRFKGFRECHINPDWLLIYSKSEEGVVSILTLVRTGTHSDLFGKNRK